MNNFVVIPAYNEGERVRNVIAKVQHYTQNIIVVDDGSSDDTYSQAKDSGATVLRHKVNLGKGATLKTGCDYALMQGAERIIVMDGDGQHDPQMIPAFLEALKEKDIVYSCRKGADVMPLVLQFGNKVINIALSKLSGSDIKDSQCGYRAFTADAYQKIRWNSQDYYMETEMILNAGRHKLRYSQIPIETIYSDKYKGTTVIDGVKIVMKMIGGRLSK